MCVPALGGCALLLSPINVTLSYTIEIIQFRGNSSPLTNRTCIHLRVKGPNIYMYRKRRIYKEPSKEIQ
jgi:hypothetical protein